MNSQPEDEEKFLLEYLNSCNSALLEYKTKLLDAKNHLAFAEKKAEDAKQAVVDYMQGNGLVETDYFKISTTTSKSVDITDIDSVPDEYIRTKKEVNKAAIKALKLPESNWLKYSEKENIRLDVK